jgi:hypothetical protein
MRMIRLTRVIGLVCMIGMYSIGQMSFRLGVKDNPPLVYRPLARNQSPFRKYGILLSGLSLPDIRSDLTCQKMAT